MCFAAPTRQGSDQGSDPLGRPREHVAWVCFYCFFFVFRMWRGTVLTVRGNDTALYAGAVGRYLVPEMDTTSAERNARKLGVLSKHRFYGQRL